MNAKETNRFLQFSHFPDKRCSLLGHYSIARGAHQPQEIPERICLRRMEGLGVLARDRGGKFDQLVALDTLLVAA